MSVSGSGNISPSGSNWDPNIMGKSADSAHEPQDLPSLNASDQGFFMASSAQASALSGAAFDYESEVQINEGKYKKTQDKTLSVKNKLRGHFSKAQASVRGFLSGFGSRASRVSARKAEIRGGGRSYLPSNTEIVNSKGNRISPELRGFYLQASGVSSQPVNIEMLTFMPSAISSFTTSLFHSLDFLEGIEAQPLNLFLMATHQELSLEDTVNLWLMARLSGEVISVLLDPNIETSSLLRRASTVGNESLDYLVLMPKESVGTQIARRSLPNEDSGTKSSESSSVSTQRSEPTEKSETTKENKDLSEELLGLSSMASSLLATPPSETFTPYALTSVDSGKSFAPTKPTSIPKTFTSKHQPIGVAKRSSQVSFYSAKNHIQAISGQSDVSHMESVYRFSQVQENFTTQGKNKSSSFIVIERNSDVTYSLPHTSSNIQYNASAEALNGEVLSASFQFSVERGVSLLPETPISVQSYHRLVQAHKGSGAPPDPLIYQYRNVSIDPPIILRSPQPFVSSARLQVQGKPEAASVYDDSESGQQFSDRQQDSDPEEQEQNHKRKSKKID